jgi:hypothetical protein
LSRAHILLHADGQATDGDMAQALPKGTATVERTRQRLVEEGLEAALTERPRAAGRRKLEGKREAVLVALAWRTPLNERQGWTRPLLADTRVERQQVASMSEETGRRTRTKTSSSRG